MFSGEAGPKANAHRLRPDTRAPDSMARSPGRHERYPKIVDSTSAWSATPPRSGSFIVTEKLHGANFSVATSSALQPVGFASRSGLLADNDGFFGFRAQGLEASLAAKARTLRSSLLQRAVGTATTAAWILDR